ncbi:MAG: sulfurase, partial [Solirubrobacterales bacterium]|nr:sulfurase [Solirubrobacterales bacterium]
MTPDPMEHAWWLGSRAAGVVALLAMATAVGLGLALAARVTRDPARMRLLGGLHQHAALTALVAIAVHGIALLGDGFLHPSVADVAVPFVMDRERVWTGLGVTGGWVAALLGLSYWLRDRLGPRRWRAAHRLTTLAYVLSVLHALGAGTDAAEPWMLVLVVGSGAPVLFLLVLRVLPAPPDGTPGFRRLRVAAVAAESPGVRSFRLEPVDRRPLAPATPGQSVPVRVPVPGHGVLQRAYSLSAAPSAATHRISVARDGVVSTHLHEAVRAGDVLEVGEPVGAFGLDPTPARPVVLLGAGIGVTPLLAMLARLAAERSPREVWWVQVARSREELPFAEEVAAHVARLPRARAHVHLTGERGRPTAADVLALGVPPDAAFH